MLLLSPRWDAGQRLAMGLLLKLYAAGRNTALGATAEERFSAAGGVSDQLVDAYKWVAVMLLCVFTRTGCIALPGYIKTTPPHTMATPCTPH